MTRRLIVIIDDDVAVREIAKMTLKLVGGYDVLDASSGQAGLELAAEARPDAILLDVMMPGLDGPATLARLQADPATAAIPVVMLTANGAGREGAALVALGARAALAKPFDPHTLVVELRAALGWSD